MRIIFIIFAVAGLSWTYNPMNAYSTGVALATFQSVDLLNTVEMDSKKCSKCVEVKLVSEFYSRKDTKDRFYNYCKSCAITFSNNVRHTKQGVITAIYSHQKASSKRRNHIPPTYTKQQFYDFCFGSTHFHRIYNDWVKSGYDKMMKPSFDRSDDSKGYSFGNFNRWMTWQENFKKGRLSIKNGFNKNQLNPVIGTHIKTGEIFEFYSISHASRCTSTNIGSIIKCCKNKIIKHTNGCDYILKKAGGYKWKYKNKNQC